MVTGWKVREMNRWRNEYMGRRMDDGYMNREVDE